MVKTSLSKLELFFLVKGQMRAIWLKKPYLYFARLIAVLVVLSHCYYIYLSLVSGQIFLPMKHSGSTHYIEQEHTRYWGAFIFHCFIILMEVHYTIIGIANLSEKKLVKRLIKLRQHVKEINKKKNKKPVGRFSIYQKASTLRAVDSDDFYSSDLINDLLREGYKYINNVEASTIDEALSVHKIGNAKTNA